MNMQILIKLSKKEIKFDMSISRISNFFKYNKMFWRIAKVEHNTSKAVLYHVAIHRITGKVVDYTGWNGVKHQEYIYLANKQYDLVD